MSILYARVLLWHKLIAQTTGGLALCSAKHRLNRDEAKAWVEAFRNVGDEIQSVLDGRGFILDDKGRRVVQSTGEDGASGQAPQEAQHVATDPSLSGTHTATGPNKAGGRRIARRKQ